MRKVWMVTGLVSLSLGLAGCGGAAEEAPEAEAAEAAADGTGEASAIAAADGDAKVPGTEYHATAPIPCGFGGAAPTGTCDAGVIRQWGEDGTTLVEVQKPDGMKRAIFVKGTEPYGADSAQADGSAGWDFTTTREGDRVTVKFGPESYVIVDAFVEGG